MADKLHFSLVAPEREVFSGEVDRVDAPGAEGDTWVRGRQVAQRPGAGPGQSRRSRSRRFARAQRSHQS